jgi:hypothetical protein
MNRLINQPRYQTRLYLDLVLTKRERDPENPRKPLEVSITRNDRYILHIIENLGFCDPTDYENYKKWIAYWKMVYKTLSDTIRQLKKKRKFYFQTEGKDYVRTDCSPAIIDLVAFANHLLRMRQQMKMLNRYYMMNRDKTNER